MGNAVIDLFPERGSNNPEAIDFAGRFALSAAPAVVAGRGFDISRAPTGLFTITTRFQWFALIGGGVYEMTANLTDAAQLVSFSPTLRQIVIQYQRGAAASDASVAEQIGFNFLLQQKGLSIK